MKKTAHFLIYRGPTWPAPTLLAPYFSTRSGQSKAFGVSNDSWGLGLEGVGGTEHLPPFNGRIDIDLTILGMPNLGVLLCYQKFAANGATFYSKGDLTKLHEWGEDYAWRFDAGWIVHSIRNGMEGSKRVHGIQRRPSKEHRLGRRARPPAGRISRSVRGTWTIIGNILPSRSSPIDF